MNNKRILVAERRTALVAQAARQRAELTEAFVALHKPFAYVDKGLFAFRYLAQHPAILTGAVALAVVMLPKRKFDMFKSGWLAWRMALATKRRLKG